MEGTFATIIDGSCGDQYANVDRTVHHPLQYLQSSKGRNLVDEKCFAIKAAQLSQTPLMKKAAVSLRIRAAAVQLPLSCPKIATAAHKADAA